MRGKIIAALGALLIAGCSSATPDASTTSQTTQPTTAASRTTVEPPATTTPPPTSSALPTLDLSDEADARFLAAIAERGVAVNDPDELTGAGYGVCGILNDPASATEDRSLISLSTWVMDVYELPGRQAGALAQAAMDVYCPGSVR